MTASSPVIEIELHDFGDGNGPVPAHRHPNGGGWVADTAWVAPTAFVGPDAQIYGKAYVSGRAFICERARVFGHATVWQRAELSGSAQVYDWAHVAGDARVYGRAHVYGHARISGDAQVYGRAHVYGDAEVSGRARLLGDWRIPETRHIFVAGPIGMCNEFVTFAFQPEGKVLVATRWFSGTLDDFVQAVHLQREGDYYVREYTALVNAVREMARLPRNRS